MRLWRDQLERRRLIIVVAWPSRDKGRAHASSMGGHVAQLRRLARQGYGGMDGSGQEALGRVERYIFCLLGASEKDDAGGGVASRCLGCLVVWSVVSSLPMRHASISGYRHSKNYR